MIFVSRGVTGALLALGLFAHATAARAAIGDYEFRLVSAQARKGQTVVDVRLVHKPDERPVPDAIVFAMRLDMAPDDMAAMTGAIEQVDSPEPGVYRFRVELTDEGRWLLSIAAKIQGEAETLQGRLVLKATP